MRFVGCPWKTWFGLRARRRWGNDDELGFWGNSRVLSIGGWDWVEE